MWDNAPPTANASLPAFNLTSLTWHSMLRCWRTRSITGAFARRKILRTFSSMETLSIPNRGSGAVKIDIHHPVAAPSASPTVTIYLPRGNLLHDQADDASNIAILKSSLPCHIVSINYRWSGEHQFPSPIHDVVAGFDWVVSNLLPKRAIARAGRADRAGRIAVCGELIGGQLATSLALTECRAGGVGISAATVNNPVIDWTAIDDLNDSRKSTQPWTTEALLKQRQTLFRKNEHWFDMFASPALLFRSAGIEVPRDVSSLPFDDMSELARLDREEFFREQLILSGVSSFGEFSCSSEEPAERVRKRKASRRFPSKALGLHLPSFRITTGEESPLADQAIEIAHLIRQSQDRAGQASSQHVQYAETPGTGLWDRSNAGRASMLESANWLARALVT